MNELSEILEQYIKDNQFGFYVISSIDTDLEEEEQDENK